MILSFLVGAAAAVVATFIVCRALSRQRLAEALAAGRGRQEALLRAIAGLAGAADEPAIRDAVLQLVSAALGASGATAIVPEEGHWRTLAATAPDIVLDVASCDRLAAEAIGAAGAEVMTEQRGAVWVPLVADGACVGILGVAGIGGAPVERQALQALAVPLALAVRNAARPQPMADVVRDPLTLCLTEAYALEAIDNELRRVRRSQMPMGLLVLEIDQLSEIGDRDGATCRDGVLSAVGHCLRQMLRTSDAPCRFRDDTFGILLPETPLVGAMHVADALRREIAALSLVCDGQPLSITASIGVTRGHPSDKTAQVAIGRAAAALQRAHADGSNCVRASTEFAPT